ncbi:hypothetical protein ACFOY5_20520, partial [Massilia aurea]|uniref:hypothetical protein n=1 Tax=Massilia aurea TaxID=373040 RepID=UPI00360A5636
SRNHLITLTFSVSAEAEANYNKPPLGSASLPRKESSHRTFSSRGDVPSTILAPKVYSPVK